MIKKIKIESITFNSKLKPLCTIMFDGKTISKIARNIKKDI